MTRSFRGSIEQLLRIDSAEKPRVYGRVFESAEIFHLNYWLELIFAAAIAALGLVLNSAAVIIGAMLISPLMGPILAAGLALAAADLYLAIKSLLNLLASTLGAVALSGFLVWMLPFQTPTAEILSRTQPNLLDLGVAIFSGLAGSIIVCRGGAGGGVTALPGVAIAVALMPPLCTVGFGVGSGWQWNIISGAGLLFLTNLVAIITSAFLVFFVVRMDSPDVRAQIDRSILERFAGDPLFAFLGHTRLSHSFGEIGKLRWRLLMLLVLLAVLAFPLRRALLQVRDETVARGAVREAIRQMTPLDTVLNQWVELTPERIRVRLILAEFVSPAKMQEARHSIMKKTGRSVDLNVRKVAGEEELATLREGLLAGISAPLPPPPQDLDSLRANALARLEQPLKQIWPAERIPLLDYEIGFGPKEVVVRVTYEAREPLDPAAEEILLRTLRARLSIENLRLELRKADSRRANATKAARVANRRP